MTSIAHAARPFRRLLDYVPDDVILEAAGREFVMNDGNKCVVGWVLRGVLARIVNKTAERVNLDFETITLDSDYGFPYDRVSESDMLSTLVGGRRDTWEKMFNGVTHDEGSIRWDGMPQVTLPIIEYAFVRRLAEAVERTRGR